MIVECYLIPHLKSEFLINISTMECLYVYTVRSSIMAISQFYLKGLKLYRCYLVPGEVKKKVDFQCFSH